jgi:hypothetical protein
LQPLIVAPGTKHPVYAIDPWLSATDLPGRPLIPNDLHGRRLEAMDFAVTVASMSAPAVLLLP